jgi:hypothetical protein
MLNHAVQGGRHSFADRGADLYETPECAVRALIAAEPLPHRIWEPACGRGAIAEPLRRAGHYVLPTDLHNYGYGASNINFLAQQWPFDGAVVTNPPFKLADQFARHAITLAPKVVMLLRLAFLESARRTDILEGGHLARVLVFANRLPMMHRDGWIGPRVNSSTAYAWFVWERSHTGPTEIRRLHLSP